MTHKVLLADDHALVRAGLKALIEAFDGFAVVAEAADGREAVAQARRLEPDIAIMDIGMPGLNGLEALGRIHVACPRCNLLVVSMHADRAHVEAAFRAGARAYVLKEAAPAELEQALRCVMSGGRHVSLRLGIDPARLGRDAVAQPAEGTNLTSRQREILQLIAEGNATREIAARLCISVKTVETHRAQLMQRLEIFDVAGLTRYAIRVGLVSSDS